MTVRHGCKCMPDASVSVEDCLLAVSSVIGGANIRSASRMNKAIVLFLSETQLVDDLIESGLTIKDTFVNVMPLSSPTKKVVLSNVPPFVRNDKLEEILERYGKLMSPVKMIPLGCKNAELRHVMSFRRQAIMILKSQNEALNLSVKLSIDNKDYTIFISSETMKCFVCGEFGHVRQNCPNKNGANVNIAAAAVSEEVKSQANSDVNSAASSEPSAVERSTPGPSHEESVVSDSSREASVNVSENRAEAQEDTDHDLQSQVEQAQSTNTTLNTEEMNCQSIEDVDSQELSVCIQTDDSDIEDDDVESILDENSGADSRQKLYSLKQINDFLDCTKGLRKPKIETFFPDLSLFLTSGTTAMKKSSFDELDRQKRYRLKKILSNVKASLQSRKK